MAYDHSRQYRCPIVRGKALTDLDNLISSYANILLDICPCEKKEFVTQFNKGLSKQLNVYGDKTLNNHRTEIAGKLFGMYYEDFTGIFHISERALKLLEDSDQPAFFKDLCAKYQFPSGMNKLHTSLEHISHGINIRQLSYVLKVILECQNLGMVLNKKEIGYYILNSLDVLKGDVNPNEVISQIIEDRKNNVERIIHIEEKASSYNYQHINEQLNLLALANIITYKEQLVYLNKREMGYIEDSANKYNIPPVFNFYSYDLSSLNERKKAEIEWDEYFGKLSDINIDVLSTNVDALVDNDNDEYVSAPYGRSIDTTALGDEGEEYVYRYEKDKISKTHPRLVNKIQKLGKIKGLGYDIQSVIGNGKNPDFVKYIEVKSTKRVTSTINFPDTVNLTRNEWTAAQQHKDYYYIYRVYFTKKDTKIFVIHNPFSQSEDGKIQAIPLNYRVDFDESNGGFHANE